MANLIIFPPLHYGLSLVCFGVKKEPSLFWAWPMSSTFFCLAKFDTLHFFYLAQLFPKPNRPGQFCHKIHEKKSRAIENSVWPFMATIGAIAPLWPRYSGSTICLQVTGKNKNL